MSNDTLKQMITDYKPPVKGKEFKAYWIKFLQKVVERDNFDKGHLKNLEILCNLYIEYDRFTKTINDFYTKEKSYSYISEGRYGTQIKTIPEFTERKNILSEIRQYARLLGIILEKDKPSGNPDDESMWS